MFVPSQVFNRAFVKAQVLKQLKFSAGEFKIISVLGILCRTNEVI